MKIKDMILIAMFAALTAVGAFIQIPTPMVSFTLQFMFCAYSGLFLGAQKAFYAQILYVGIGLAGIPVFTKGGGIGYVFQPTFGYLVGFIFCATIIGFITTRIERITFGKMFFSVLAGLTAVYTLGIPYLYLMINRIAEIPITFEKALAVGFLPFIIPDLIWTVLIALTAVKIVPILRKHGYIDDSGRKEKRERS